MRLGGKVAIVTGGGSGIGRGIVLAMAREGADVAIPDIQVVNAEKVAQEVQALGRKAFALKPGQRAVLRVRVPAKARRLVARHRKVRALARAGIARQRLMLLRAR